jgi:hypothetical protein
MHSSLKFQKVGYIETERVELDTYETQASELGLPAKSLLMLQKNPDQYLIFLSPVLTSFIWEGVRYEFSFKKGYMTDFGSVPPIFRSFIDNDDPHAIFAFLVHDALYQTRCLEVDPNVPTTECWRKANRIMYELLKEGGVNVASSLLATIGVMTGVGWREYRTRSLFDLEVIKFCKTTGQIARF